MTKRQRTTITIEAATPEAVAEKLEAMAHEFRTLGWRAAGAGGWGGGPSWSIEVSPYREPPLRTTFSHGRAGAVMADGGGPAERGIGGTFVGDATPQRPRQPAPEPVYTVESLRDAHRSAHTPVELRDSDRHSNPGRTRRRLAEARDAEATARAHLARVRDQLFARGFALPGETPDDMVRRLVSGLD